MQHSRSLAAIAAALFMSVAAFASAGIAGDFTSVFTAIEDALDVRLAQVAAVGQRAHGPSQVFRAEDE